MLTVPVFIVFLFLSKFRIHRVGMFSRAEFRWHIMLNFCGYCSVVGQFLRVQNSTKCHFNDLFNRPGKTRKLSVKGMLAFFVIFWSLGYFSSWEIGRLIPFCPCYWQTLRLGRQCYKVALTSDYIRCDQSHKILLSYQIVYVMGSICDKRATAPQARWKLLRTTCLENDVKT